EHDLARGLGDRAERLAAEHAAVLERQDGGGAQAHRPCPAGSCASATLPASPGWTCVMRPAHTVAATAPRSRQPVNGVLRPFEWKFSGFTVHSSSGRISTRSAG